MADIHKFSAGLSEETKNQASIPEVSDDVSAIQSASVSPDVKGRGQKFGGTLEQNDGVSADEDLLEVSRVVKAVDRFLTEDADHLPEQEEQPRVFSKEYEARKQQMLQTAFDWNESDSRTKPKRRFRIPAAVAAAIAVFAITASLMNVSADAMPEPIRILMMRMNSLFSEASVDKGALYADNQARDYPKEILTVYEPTMVLDGYEVSNIISQSKKHIVRYTTEDRKEYIFRQMAMDYWLGYNTEDVDYEEIKVDGRYPGITYIQNDQCYVQWQRDKYVFEICGKLERSELEMAAASVEPLEELDAQ